MRRKRVDPTGLLITVGLHVVVVIALLSHHPTRQKLAQVAPLVVKLITPAVPQPAPPPPPALRTPPRLTAPVQPRLELPQVVLAPVEPTRPAPPAPSITPSAPAPTPAPAPTASPSVSESRTSAPVEITPPVFNADYLENPSPAYPSTSRRAGEQGKVILRVLVNAVGRADEIQLRTSSGFVRLDEAARATVLRWKFVPARRGSEPIAAWVLIPISFRLER